MPAIEPPTSDRAIAAALRQDWKEAIKLNSALIKKNSQDVDALNRLGFAYLKTGQITKSKRTYQKVLAFDPYNQISLKNLNRLGSVKKKSMVSSGNTHISPLLFLEEPGKTKIASCINLAPNQILSSVSPGQEVYLKAKNHVVEIRDEKHTYLGALPDDLSFRLIRLLTGGNRYQVIIKGAAKNSLTVILREVSRSKRYAQYPSFTPSISYIPYSRQKEQDGPDMTPTGDEEDKNDTES